MPTFSGTQLGYETRSWSILTGFFLHCLQCEDYYYFVLKFAVSVKINLAQ